MEIKFRDLKADEIDCRIGQIFDGGITLLLYTDARACQSILDETVGPLNWQSQHYELKGRIFCKVGIFDKVKGEWTWKSDCGTESYTEKEKGEASDSFKRACVNWGIGRGLYSAPAIILYKETIGKDNGKGFQLKKKEDRKANYRVSTIQYENGEINKLVVLENGKTVFNFEKNVNKEKLLDLIKNTFDEAMIIKDIIDSDYGGKKSIDLTEKEAKEILYKLMKKKGLEEVEI